MKNLAILGSTGSIGRNTLQIVERFPDRYRVRVLAAKTSVDLLAEQILRFRPEVAVVFDAFHARALKEKLGGGKAVDILWGEAGYIAAATLAGVDILVAAMMGAAGLMPTLAAIEAGADIALANKETLVMAGTIVMDAARRSGVRILPVDSEHSAIFQCLSGQRREDVDRIILTASGGPFRTTPGREFAGITPAHALKHPNWAMGPKITIDSATLMNKGLEVIEAGALFGLSPDRIEVLVHPQSIIHSMVAYCDGSVIAQLGIPDMKEAIAYALSCPERLPLGQPLPEFSQIGQLTFEPPDPEKFPCLAHAFEACRTGHTLPAVMNAANEVVVGAFLDHKIPFPGIPEIIKTVMDRHRVTVDPGLEEIIAADRWARQETGTILVQGHSGS